MQFDAVLLSPRRTESIARGYWHDRTINQELDACLAECPDKLALTAVRVVAGEVRRFTYREMATLADRIAVGLSRLFSWFPRDFGISITRRWRAVFGQNCRPSSALSWSRAVARMISMPC